MTVDVTIAFNYEDQYWTHIFDIDVGSTVLQLKEKMLQPKGGTKQDVDSFELRLRGQRVSDAEEIYQQHTLDFEYLGPEEGSKRAQEDEQDQKKREREKADAMAASRRRAQQPAAARQPAGGQQAAKPSKPTPAKVTAVNVVVKHAVNDEEMKSQVTVEVQSNATILDVRRAVMSAINESKLSEVKIVKKVGQSFQSCGDADPIGNTREFLSMGRKLDAPTGDLVITVTIDAELDFKSAVTVARGTTMAALKDIIAAQDPTGSTEAASFGLGFPSASGAAAALPDTTIISDKHVELQVTEPYVAPAEEAAPAPAPVIREVVPGVPIWKVVGGSDKGGILVRRGRDTSSEQLPARLATGAIVEQLALEGERLHYNKITGGGPPEGWVSLTVGGKELLRRHPAEHPDAFVFERAVALQKELRDRFASDQFRNQIAQLISDIPKKKGAEYLKRRSEIILGQQMECIPQYGFEGSQRGVQAMMAAFGPHMGSPITQGINNEINALLS